MPTFVMPLLRGTLPGYPYAPQPPAFESFMVIAGIPLVITLLFVMVGLGKAWMSKDRDHGLARDVVLTLEAAQAAEGNKELTAH